MTFRDLLDAELGLFGSYSKQLGVRHYPGGEDRIDDAAQAWIDGNQEPGLKAQSEHEAKVRARPVIVRFVHERIRRLRLEGRVTSDIAKELGCNENYVRRICHRELLPAPINVHRVIAEMLSRGCTRLQIAEATGLSMRTLLRHLRELGSVRPYKRRRRTSSTIRPIIEVIPAASSASRSSSTSPSASATQSSTSGARA